MNKVPYTRQPGRSSLLRSIGHHRPADANPYMSSRRNHIIRGLTAGAVKGKILNEHNG